jgi:hypothetical protein
MNLQVEVSVTKMEYSKDPGVQPTFAEPTVIPTLGIGHEDSVAPTPQVSLQLFPTPL